MTVLLDRPSASDEERELRADLVDRASKLVPLLSGFADRTDRERLVVEENIRALRQSELLAVSRPRRFGGLQCDVRTSLEVSREVARGCGSTAWTTTLLNVCAWLVGLWPEQAQNDVWGTDHDALVAGVLAPTATALEVDGGYRVTGRWSPASGSSHAQWAIVGIPLLDDRGDPRDVGMVLLPMTDLTIEDTWFVTGMRGTASNTFVADDVFVPAHRYISSAAATVGRFGTPFVEEAIYRSAFVPVTALVLAGPQLGLAQAALDLVVEKAPRRGVSYTSYGRQADAPTVQLAVAKAASMLDSAHLHAYRAAADIDDAAARGVYPDYDARARMRMDTGVAVTSAREAIRTLVSAHGAASFAESNPLQRIWRDSETSSRHAIVAPEISTEIYGKSLLGIRGDVSDLV